MFRYIMFYDLNDLMFQIWNSGFGLGQVSAATNTCWQRYHAYSGEQLLYRMELKYACLLYPGDFSCIWRETPANVLVRVGSRTCWTFRSSHSQGLSGKYSGKLPNMIRKEIYELNQAKVAVFTDLT